MSRQISQEMLWPPTWTLLVGWRRWRSFTLLPRQLMVIIRSSCTWIGKASRPSRTLYISGIWNAARDVSKLAISPKSAVKEQLIWCSGLGRPKSTIPLTPPIPLAPLKTLLKPLTPSVWLQNRPATNGRRSLEEEERKRGKSRRRHRPLRRVPQPKLKLHHILLQ